MSMTVLIAGAGIAGLATAVALQRAGHRVRLYEQHDLVPDAGAGISLGATAMAALRYLGLGEAIERAGDPVARSAVFHYATGEALVPPPPAGGSAKLRAAHYQLHRADLMAILLDAVCGHDADALDYGRRATGYRQDDRSATLVFDDGTCATGDLVIGTDGLRSQLRAAMHGPSEPRFTGQVAYRFLTPRDAVRGHMGDIASALHIGPGKTVLSYLVRKGTLVNTVAFVETSEWTQEGWMHSVPPAEMLDLFADWHDDVVAIMRAAPEQATAKWALYDRPALPSLVDGRVALLGDAAHPILPFLGLGAALGLEDAVVLARALQADPEPPQRALRIYERARLPRVIKVGESSRQQGEIFQAMDPQSRGQRTGPATFAPLYEYDPSSVPLPELAL